MQDLQTLRDEALSALAAAGDGDALEAWRIQYLGRKGAVLELLRGHSRSAGRRAARLWSGRQRTRAGTHNGV